MSEHDQTKCPAQPASAPGQASDQARVPMLGAALAGLGPGVVQRKIASRAARGGAAVIQRKLNDIDQGALDTSNQIKQLVASGTFEEAYRVLNGLWMRDLMYALGRLKEAGLLTQLRDQIAVAQGKFNVPRLQTAIDTAQTGKAGTSPDGEAGQTTEMEAFADLRKWPTVLPPATGAPPWDHKRQMICDFVKIQRQSLADKLKAKAGPSPAKPKPAPKATELHAKLAALWSYDAGIRDVLLDAGFSLDGAGWLAVNTDLLGVDKGAAALATLQADADVLQALDDAAASVPGWNSQEWLVDASGQRYATDKAPTGQKTLRRTPLSGLTTLVASAPYSGGGPKIGQAIALVPSDLVPGQAVEVLLHIHGDNVGYRQGAAADVPRDAGIEQIEQQLLTLGRPVVGLLVQRDGHGYSLDPSKGRFDSDAFIDEAMARVFPKPPTISHVIISAHSGGGVVLDPLLVEAQADPAKSHLPHAHPLREIILGDAINKDSAVYAAWVTRQINTDIAAMTPMSPADRLVYLQGGIMVRAYCTLGYEANYAPFDAAIKSGLASAAKKLSGDQPAIDGLTNKYKVIHTGLADHDSMIGKSQALVKGIGDLPP